MEQKKLILVVIFTLFFNLTSTILLDSLFSEKEFDKIKAESQKEAVTKIEDLSQKIIKYGLTDILTTYTTYFDPNEENRVINIKQAAESIDKVLVMPGAVFSFNDIVGPRTKARGYKKAPEIIQGEFVDGVGGGICQVTSTLYNVVLLTRLDVLARQNHSRPVSYLDMGREATIYYDSIDFKFKNNREQPVIILSSLQNDQLTISLLGKKLTNESVSIKTRLVEVLSPEMKQEFDADLNRGTEKILQVGQDGYVVEVIRIIGQGDKRREEFISRDVFSPVDGVIAIHPADR